MIDATPGSNFEARVTGFPANLVGTVGVRILDNIGGTTSPRTSGGILENPAGSGSYVVTLVAPLVPGEYSVFWDDGDVDPSSTASEDLRVTGGLLATPTLPGEILASLDDINANLDGEIVVATPENTGLLQVSVARVVRGYLNNAISLTTLASWNTPDNTPEIIREIAGKLIASQLYFQQTSRTQLVIDDEHFAQRKYDEAMALLNQILGGSIIIDEVVIDSPSAINSLDFFPVDDTDRAFTLGMEL